MAEVVDKTSGGAGAGVSLQAPTDPGGLSNKLLILAYAVYSGSDPTPSAVTYDGTDISANLIYNTTDGWYSSLRIYYVKNPASAATFAVTVGGGGTAACAILLKDIDQTTIFRTITLGDARANPSTLAVTNSQSGDLILGLHSVDHTASADGLTQARMGAGQTYLFQENRAGEIELAGCTEPGASGTVTNSWEFVDNASNGFLSIAIPLITSASGVTVTQTSVIAATASVLTHSAATLYPGSVTPTITL